MIFSIIVLLLSIQMLYATRQSVLLISFDGFQSGKFEEFIKENPNSNFSQFVSKSLKSDFMTPSTPSATYPNHITLVTGLNPESHGIVNNVVYDPNFNTRIRLSQADDVKWWNASEPIWFTAKKQGLKTASSFWVGDFVFPRQPDTFIPYNSKYDPFIRIDELINWYKKFDPELTCLYFDEPDTAGHLYGPESQQYKDRIRYMDTVFGYLIDQLDKNKIREKLNMIVVSDHGMAQLNNSQFVFVKDYVNSSLIDFDKSVFGILSNIFPKSDDKLNELYQNMLKIPHMNVFLKRKMPEEFHYSNNDRIGKIVVFANEGYRLMDENYTYIDYGSHGYLANLTSMRAIFMAQGPSFKSGNIGSFPNVNVYPLMCKILDLKCQSNNGSTKVFESFLLINHSSQKSISVLTLILSLLVIFSILK